MSKKMCSAFGKGVAEEKKDKFVSAVKDAKYFCPKCGRVANDSDMLCKDKKLKVKDKDK